MKSIVEWRWQNIEWTNFLDQPNSTTEEQRQKIEESGRMDGKEP